MAQGNIKLGIEVRAIDKFSGGLNKLGKSLTKISAIAGGVLAAGLTKATKAFFEQEKAEARLFAITKNVTKATDEQRESLLEQARALQKVGIFGDEVTIAAQSQLATFQLTTNQIKQLTPAILDTVAAEQGFAATTESVISSINRFGVAITTGTLGRLAQAGIAVNEAQAEMFKLADQTERVNILTEILGQNYGGLNEQFAQTAQGALAQAKNAWGDLLEVIGEAFIPILVPLANKIQTISERLKEMSAADKELLTGIIVTTGGIIGITFAMGVFSIAASLASKNVLVLLGALRKIATFLKNNPVVLTVLGGGAVINKVSKFLFKNFEFTPENAGTRGAGVAAQIQDQGIFGATGSNIKRLINEEFNNRKSGGGDVNINVDLTDSVVTDSALESLTRKFGSEFIDFLNK